MPTALTLNPTWLRNRLAQLGLRQCWLAEQLGVDRKTVLRWVNGQVRSIQPANAQALASVLSCGVDELLLHDGAAHLATSEDQHAAGLALDGSQLLDRLGPVGEWDVVEQLVKAAAVPDLPLHVLGRLYHQLCVACWRQDKLALAWAHNDATLALARRCDDHGLLADALGSRANLQFWRGEWPAARTSWQQALALSAWLTPRQRGALHSNLGASLQETGEPEAGRQQLQLALDCFDIEGTPMNHAIARAHLALAALSQGDADEGERQAQRADAAAQRGDYRRGLALGPLLQGLVAARRGQRPAALEGVRLADQRFAALGLDESHRHLLAARAHRWLGEPAQALARAQRAVQRAASHPLERAAALHEQALCEALQGLGDGGAAAHATALALYRQCGAGDMARALAAAWRAPAMSLHVTRQDTGRPLP